MSRRGVGSVCLAGAALAWGSLGAQTMEQPDWRVGDKKVFQVKSSDGSTTSSSFEIVNRTATHLEVRNERGEMADRDFAFNIVPKGNRTYTRTMALYPLKVGDEWKFAGQNPGQVEETGVGRVVAYEKVSVPAGTFDCFRTEIRTTFGGMSASSESLWTRWLCPGAKGLVKASEETRRFNRYGPGSRTITDMELVEFVSGK